MCSDQFDTAGCACNASLFTVDELAALTDLLLEAQPIDIADGEDGPCPFAGDDLADVEPGFLAHVE